MPRSRVVQPGASAAPSHSTTPGPKIQGQTTYCSWVIIFQGKIPRTEFAEPKEPTFKHFGEPSANRPRILLQSPLLSECARRVRWVYLLRYQ